MRLPRSTTARPVSASPRPTADSLSAAIARLIGQDRFDRFFRTHTKISIDETGILIAVPNPFQQEWLAKRFGRDIQSAAREVAGRTVAVRYIVNPELFARGKPAVDGKSGTPQYVEPPPRGFFDSAPSDAPPARSAPRPARRWRRLDEFVVGPCNRLAFAASQSAVESPGQGPLPLVIHGPVGTGKTHLLEAIYVGLRQGAGQFRVTFATAEEFTNRFIQAMRTGKSAQFRKQFRECDALLLDGLHFLAGKQKTQEEFLHTFDALSADGKIVVVTCDCHPRLTDDFTPELADRLMGGAVLGLQPPDAATRLDLLRAKSARVHAVIGEDVLKFLADQLRGNVRELEGAINSLRHFSRVTGRPIDVGLAREALGDLLRHSVRLIHLTDIDAAVCQILRLPAGALQAKVRNWSVSHPRMLAIYLARKHTSASYSEVGAYFGGRNHSTAVAAEKKVRQWLAEGESLAMEDRSWRIHDIVERVERVLGR